ncbi:hypothetical protein F5878DRAFT_666967 [Lentinula raphanica]|uniref:Uncharacterized protein n=1 Tax=Lentinula raphanica TaxID=153919 RepID=A0AA38NWN4_9AGAR|nr:hypothetical protein F5878DRAFT_666967 [Lentinula raphanica]
MDIDYNEGLDGGSDGSVVLADEEIEKKLVPSDWIRSERHWTHERTDRIMQEFNHLQVPVDVIETPPLSPTSLPERLPMIDSEKILEIAKQVIEERDEAIIRANAAQAELYQLRKLMMNVGNDLHDIASALSIGDSEAKQQSWMHLTEVASALTSAGRNGSKYNEQKERRLRRLNPLYNCEG